MITESSSELWELPQNSYEYGYKAAILWAPQFSTVLRLLIHQCKHHHSLSFLVISSESSKSPSLTSGPQLIIILYLILPQIHLSCGAFALHTILVLSQFPLNKVFLSWNLLYIFIWPLYINFFPFASSMFYASFVPMLLRDQNMIALLCLQHWYIVAMTAVVQVGRSKDNTWVDIGNCIVA